jgi:Glucose/sorbosone dehydrogenases
VQFGQDGLLYASDGDSAPFDTATIYSTRAQEPGQTVGKLYRMTASGQGLSSNPFWTGNANDAASKVFALGLRNPFRFTTRPDGSVIVGDVGWNTWEELDRVSVGSGNHNYGWPCYEGWAYWQLESVGVQRLYRVSGVGAARAWCRDRAGLRL